ncbi:hypothetical protein RhiirA1_460459 [Rhizophagus irregularis]|uniref:Uncharacterized protein n=1 Tax=Rhizophagus irregularis TaxID=588596 RepID=A0A2I1EJU7_9GLOM|nr:hypothetical protein RhiirA1_460459 [Rhizophagus irregularis]PKY22398.1 hypothetical protein RhiirB3_503144 [Rhizophagus irregularis]PKY30117.1 hypothetical protein RhiirB3_447046 [Rhizophagus irregularis]CAB4479377.1 unnamed protein product [Rhizophagus irregularis]CAB5362598.1 unnamed protein product [Rhizophagus irregularis]
MKLLILIVITLIILLQFVYEVNTQAPKDAPLPPQPPPEDASSIGVLAESPTPAIPPLTKINTLSTLTPISTGKLLPSSGSRTSSVNSSNPSESGNSIAASIIGGTVSNLILIFIVGLYYFLVRMYKDKKENSKAIATPGLNNNENIISNPGITNNGLYNNEPIPTELIISNYGQEFVSNSPNYNNNQRGITRELGNNSTNNEIIQNIRQGKLSSFNIDEVIIDQIKQDILQDIKQELKQNIKSEVMTSFVRDNNVEDDSSSSTIDNHGNEANS